MISMASGNSKLRINQLESYNFVNFPTSYFFSLSETKHNTHPITKYIIPLNFLFNVLMLCANVERLIINASDQ